MKIDVERCINAMKDLEIGGAPRNYLIEEAIKIIQTGSDYLDSRYLGIKNYASFGDQREDHQYGYGPKHGSIVFRIEKTYEARKNGIKLNDEHIYLLECYRDFGVITDEFDLHFDNRKPKIKTLCTVIQSFIQSKKQYNFYTELLNSCEVDSMLGI